jgi:hypothetical protein
VRQFLFLATALVNRSGKDAPLFGFHFSAYLEGSTSASILKVPFQVLRVACCGAATIVDCGNDHMRAFDGYGIAGNEQLEYVFIDLR